MNEENGTRLPIVGLIAMRECGFELVELDQVGAPTPGRVADRLHDIVEQMEDDVLALDGEIVVNALSSLKCLLLALDTWDAWMMQRIAARNSAAWPIGSNAENPPS